MCALPKLFMYVASKHKRQWSWHENIYKKPNMSLVLFHAT